MRKLALAAYLLVAGGAAGLSPYFWQVWLRVSILGFIVIDTLGTGRIVAAEFVAGGDISQSPCIVRDRVIPPPPRQISADEARADDIRGVAGGLNQFGTPMPAPKRSCY